MTRRIMRRTSALFALVAVVGVVPYVLARWGAWPISGLPTGQQFRDLPTTVLTDTTVFAVVTVAAWIVWVLFCASVILEIGAVVRGIEAPHLPAAGALQLGARHLVAALLMTVAAYRPIPAQATARLPARLAPTSATHQIVAPDASVLASPALAGAPPPVNGTVATDAVPSPAETLVQPTITVSPGDSAWQIAETYLHDGMRWRDLWDLNQGVPQTDGRAWTDPQLLLPGWQLQLPGTSTPGGPRPAAQTVAGPTGDIVYVVVPGDTLSDIAARYLGDPGRYVELFDANHDRNQPDGRRLDDPSLIRPGWQLLIPVTAPTAPPIAPPALTETDPSVPPADASGTLPPPPSDPAPSTSPSTDSSPATTVPSSRPAPPPVRHDTVTPNDADSAVPGSVAVTAGITGAIVLATSIGLLLVRLRRRRAIRGASYTRLPPTSVEELVVAAADVPLVRWAGQHLARLMGRLDRRQLTAAPLAVELSEDTGIEVLWDAPQNAPTPTGWTVADGGWSWRLAYDPDAPIPADELPAAVPALVTIGQRDGRQLLIDLEAVGVLTVSGPQDHVDGFLRALAVELASGNDLSDAYVSTINLDTGLDEPLDRLLRDDPEDALRRIDGTRHSIREALDQAGLTDTFTARAGATTPIEATVVVAHAIPPDTLALLTAATVPRGGVALITSTTDAPAATGGAHVTLSTDGTALLEPLGVRFRAANLPLATSDQLRDALTALADLDPGGSDTDVDAHITIVTAVTANGDRTPTHRCEPSDTDLFPGLVSTDARDLQADAIVLSTAPFAWPAAGQAPSIPETDPADVAGNRHQLRPDEAAAEPLIVVRVLGVPSIPQRPDIGRRELILAVLLACRGGLLAASAAQDALWGGKPVEAKTVWNFIAATRRALGAFDDGQPLMPSVDRSRGMLRLDPRVTTDLAELSERLDRARSSSSSEAIILLHEGLGFVEGPPFDAAGYDWAHRDQDVAHASTVIEQAADTLVGLALENDQVDVARDAITRGLRGLPGNEQLYRCRMRVEHHAGRHAGIAAAYDELTVYLADLATEPSTATTALYHELIRHAPR